jgi:hypothetical protein
MEDETGGIGSHEDLSASDDEETIGSAPALFEGPTTKETASPEPTPRKVAGDRYRLGAMLGEGGMARVFAADDTDLDRSVAVDDAAPSPRRIRSLLREEGLRAKVIASHGRFLDVLPERAGKGEAVRYLAGRWGMSLDAVVTAGDSGNDLDMLRLPCPGIVVGNGARELRSLRGRSNIYFAEAGHAAGIREGLRFFGVAGGENP